jgi:hypothetical protein
MEKLLTLIFLSMIAFNTIHAEITWTLLDDGTLTISGTDMPDYKYDNHNDSYNVPWYNQQDKVKKVIIEKGVTNVGNFAFGKCVNLTSISIPNSVTTIGQQAFYDCVSLTSVTIPYSVTDIRGYAFSRCSGLTSIIVEKENTKYDSRNNCNAIIETQSNTLLVGCKNSIIPNTVTSIGFDAFNGCSNLTSISIPNSITSIGWDAFSGCSSLTSITIPNSVTSIEDGTFSGCSGLTSITIPNSVTSIGVSAFSGCSGLTSVTIPNSVTSIGWEAFRGCSGLTSVTIPNSVTTIGNWAFYECEGLTSVTIPNSVTRIEYGVFSGCSDLTSITVEEENTCYDSRNNCNAIIETKTNTLISGCKNTIIPNSVQKIGDHAFEGCFGLPSFSIPNSVTSIGEDAFWCCYNINSVTIPNSVKNIGKDAFYGCDLRSIVVEKGNAYYDSRNNCNAIIETESNTLIRGCQNTTIPNSVQRIGENAFHGTHRLTSLTIPNSVTSIGTEAFYGCFGLTDVIIPNSVTSIGYGAFWYCSGLTSITCEANTPPSCNIFLYDNRDIPLYVPANSVDAYKKADVWKYFTNIQAIPTTYTLADGELYNIDSQFDGCDISYTRTFNNTNWQALYIPFSLNYNDWNIDFEIAYINGVRQLDKDDNGTIDETIMDVIKIKSGSTTPNMPYLIKAKTTGEKTFSVSNATLYAAEENSLDCSTTIAKYTFTGTYSSIPSETMIANNYYAMGGGDLIQSDGSNDLKPYRWYMKVESRNPSYNVGNAAKSITINVIGNEEEETTTGVKELRITNDELPVYDINGRMVSDKNLKPGLYIKNGKKFVVK